MRYLHGGEDLGLVRGGDLRPLLPPQCKRGSDEHVGSLRRKGTLLYQDSA